MEVLEGGLTKQGLTSVWKRWRARQLPWKAHPGFLREEWVRTDKPGPRRAVKSLLDPTHCVSCLVAHTCNPRTREVEAMGTEAQGPHSKVETSLGHERPCLEGKIRAGCVDASPASQHPLQS